MVHHVFRESSTPTDTKINCQQTWDSVRDDFQKNDNIDKVGSGNFGKKYDDQPIDSEWNIMAQMVHYDSLQRTCDKEVDDEIDHLKLFEEIKEEVAFTKPDRLSFPQKTNDNIQCDPGKNRSSYIEFVVEVLVAGDSFFGIELGYFMAYIIDVVVVLIADRINMTETKRKLWLNYVVSLASGAKMIIFYIVYVSHMVERTKKTFKDIPIELVGLMSIALTMIVKYNEVDVHTVYLVVFEQMGRKCAKYLVSICALIK
ncbi:hypothetical protein GQ457_10G020170 [Hibiscus cannabinus]